VSAWQIYPRRQNSLKEFCHKSDSACSQGPIQESKRARGGKLAFVFQPELGLLV
jgi:hypothetical protein